ncbi:MAG: NADH-quinone oxidoreductase subunit H [Anaerolineales bacterium]|nr:NADH-quinone oxidoreductase subunit H [Anaerolineales bacterium]
MSIGWALLALLVFPGLLYAAPMAWLMLWLERKLLARLQGRMGPPFYQPFFDFVKLMAKRPLPRPGFDGLLLAALPLLAVGAILGALALLPIFPTSTGFAGDLVLLVALLEVPALCAVLAGFASRSLFGQVGATREAVLSLAYNLPFLTALLTLAAAAGSLGLADVAGQTGLGSNRLVRLLAGLALTLCLPVKLRLNPFSLANAEQEIYTGPTTEFGGSQLALWELAHGLEWVVLTGLVVSLGLPLRTGFWLADAGLWAVLSLILVVVLTILAAGTARLKVPQAARFYWRWGLGLAVLALILAMLPVSGG